MDFIREALRRSFGIDEASLTPRDLAKAAPGGRTRAQVFADNIEAGHHFNISPEKLDKYPEGAATIKIQKKPDIINGLRKFDGTTKIYDIPELARFRYMATKKMNMNKDDYEREQKKRDKINKKREAKGQEPTGGVRYLTFPSAIYDVNGKKIRDFEKRVSLAQILKDLSDFGFKNVAEERALLYKNKGDITEGIMAAALAAKFRNPSKEITIDDIWATIDEAVEMNEGGMETEGKDSFITYRFPKEGQENQQDYVSLYLKLTSFAMTELSQPEKRPNINLEALGVARFVNVEVTSTALRWANDEVSDTIEVKTIGTSDGGRSTTADLKVVYDGEERQIGNISLKTGSTKQVGQVASNKFETIRNDFFGALFGEGVASQLDKYHDEYVKAFNRFKKTPSRERRESRATQNLIKVFRKMYKVVFDSIKNKFDRNANEKEFLINLGNTIKSKAEGESGGDVYLVHVNNGEYHQLYFGDIAKKMADELTLDVTFDRKKPSIYIHAKKQGDKTDNSNKFVSFRPKWEYGDASIRQYIDKEKSIFDILRYHIKKDEEDEG